MVSRDYKRSKPRSEPFSGWTGLLIGGVAGFGTGLILLPLVTWTLGTVAVFIIGRSVGIDLAPLDAVFVASALALGVAIPSSPGYVGTYQWLGVASLGLLDVPVNEARAMDLAQRAGDRDADATDESGIELRLGDLVRA